MPHDLVRATAHAHPMDYTLRATTVVPVSPDDVFDVLTDLDRLPDWNLEIPQVVGHRRARSARVGRLDPRHEDPLEQPVAGRRARPAAAVASRTGRSPTTATRPMRTGGGSSRPVRRGRRSTSRSTSGRGRSCVGGSSPSCASRACARPSPRRSPRCGSTQPTRRRHDHQHDRYRGQEVARCARRGHGLRQRTGPRRTVEGIAFDRAVFEPGWKWSEHVKPIAGTESCEFPHRFIVTEGSLHIRMDDGTELDVGPGEAAVVPPGHDAWVSATARA